MHVCMHAFGGGGNIIMIYDKTRFKFYPEMLIYFTLLENIKSKIYPKLQMCFRKSLM